MSSIEGISASVRDAMHGLPVAELLQAADVLQAGVAGVEAVGDESTAPELHASIGHLGEAQEKVGNAASAIVTAREHLGDYLEQIGATGNAAPDQPIDAARSAAAAPILSDEFQAPPIFYAGEQAGLDRVPQSIYGMIGDVVSGVVVFDMVRAEAEKVADQRRAAHFSLRTRARQEIVEEAFRDTLSAFLNSPRMTEIRAQATAVYERYDRMQARGYGSADSHFSRRAEELQGAVRRYASGYFNPFDGRMSRHEINTLTMTADEVVEEMRQRRAATEAAIAQSGHQRTTRGTHSFLYQNTEGVRYSSVSVHTEVADGHVEEVTFDNFHSFGEELVYSWESLAVAAREGAQITDAQRAVLIRKGLMKAGWSSRKRQLDPETEAMVEAIVASPELAGSLPSNDQEINYLFAATLPPDLAQRVAGRGRWWNAKNQPPLHLGAVDVDIRAHDYDHWQTVIRLDTRGWPDEDIDQLLRRYTLFVQHFPRMAAPTTRAYTRYMENLRRS